MSDTPETDKNTWSDSSEGILYKVVTSDFARRLERERDEAREKLADALQEVDLRTLDFDRMRAERDEAREKIERQAERISNLFEKDQTRLLMERDEARDQVEELTAVIKGLRAIMRQEAAK